ncbi:MAG TPA: magnesium chelatase subunit D family protein [Propionibacteriaceae bacterium]|nr:magnesium chelatase subunit D family protein [Propionibacteriaceae bacterium]
MSHSAYADPTQTYRGRGYPQEGYEVRAFPFSAVVGSEDMALALILTTVSPEVGGVLVRGEKGTAKTTMVRALAQVLPSIAVVEGCRFSCDPLDIDPTCPDGPHDHPAARSRPARLVELPVGATEDRVIGSLDLRQALGVGEVVYEPGLLAAAHRGILYVDEVNLLHDHLVDLLLDAAAMGRSTVERDGVSVAHAARLILIGTMNPEEGELRPQLLDRFGLTVEISAPRDPELRAEVIRRRMAFDRDPASFIAAYAADEHGLRARIDTARTLVPSVRLADRQLATIARVCAAFEVDGMRADIVTARAAAAHAAWHGRPEITKPDIRAAARLALPHRRRRNPFDAPGLDEALLDQLLDEEPDPEPTPPNGGHRNGPSTSSPHNEAAHVNGHKDMQFEPVEGASTSSVHQSPQPINGPSTGSERIVSAGETYRTRLFTARGIGTGEAGRRSRAITSTGRTVGAVPIGNDSGRLHLTATIRAAAPHQAPRGRLAAGRLRLATPDLRLAVSEGRESNLVLLVVDASGSMAARRRMEAVKAAALSLLLDAYQRRDKVGLITFRGAEATLALPPTSSIDTAARRMGDLPSGGRTPLAEGLLCAAETLRLEQIRDPRRRPLLVLVTDGRATHGPDAVDRSQRTADRLRRAGVASLVIDCESGRMSLGLAQTLSIHLGAQYVTVDEVGADQLVRAVRQGRAA